MFERTFSFWRRLVKGGNDSTTNLDGAAADERRLWIRYPADLETNVQLSPRTLPIKSPARIRDLSRGGANLLLDHEVQPGQVIHLEIPHPTEGDFSILACVVRAQREPSGKWALGCVFARELPQDDLQELGASRVRHAPEDKRIWMRFPTALRASFNPISAHDGPAIEAEVYNLSANGVGLLVTGRIEPGVLLNVKLTSHDRVVTRTLLSCVVHVSQREGQWALGCNFIRELSDEDLRAMI